MVGPIPIWLIALVVAVLAPVGVQAYARFIERRTRRRTEDTLARAFGARPSAEPPSPPSRDREGS